MKFLSLSRTDVPPRETSPAGKSEEKRLFSQATSYDLFASARKAVFPSPTATGVHRLRSTWPSLLSRLVDNYASFASRIQVHGRGPRNYNEQPRLVGGGVERVGER